MKTCPKKKKKDLKLIPLPSKIPFVIFLRIHKTIFFFLLFPFFFFFIKALLLVLVWIALKLRLLFREAAFSFLFFFFSRIFGGMRLLFNEQYMNSSRKCWLFSMNSIFVYYSRTHKFHFLSTFSLKMGPTVLFIRLKIILLQWFQQ